MTYTSLIVPIVHRWLPGAKVILFGSRARGDHHQNSDWDILVITKEKIDWSKTYLYPSPSLGKDTILNELSNILNGKVDLLLYSQEDVDNRMLLPGHVLSHAMREGRVLSIEPVQPVEHPE